MKIQMINKYYNKIIHNEKIEIKKKQIIKFSGEQGRLRVKSLPKQRCMYR